MSDNKDRAFCKINGRYRHVHILRRYQQAVLFGEPIEMATVKLGKSSKEKYEVEFSRLEDKRPKPRRVRA